MRRFAGALFALFFHFLSASAQMATVTKREPAATSIDTFSLGLVLVTALPQSLVNLILTNPDAATSVIASEISDGHATWFTALPSDVQSFLLPGTTYRAASRTTSLKSSATKAAQQTDSPTQASGGLSSGAKIGIGIGVAVGVILIATAFGFGWYFSSKKKGKTQVQQGNNQSSGNTTQKYEPVPQVNPTQPPSQYPQQAQYGQNTIPYNQYAQPGQNVQYAQYAHPYNTHPGYQQSQQPQQPPQQQQQHHYVQELEGPQVKNPQELHG